PIGQHKLSIYISVNHTTGNPPWLVSGEKTVYFTVSTTKTDDAPITGGKVNIYSPSNKTYSPTDVIPIEVSASTIAVQDLAYSAIYSIDGQEPLKLATKSFQEYQYDLFFGSMTGTGKFYSLPEGQHNVTVLLKAYLRSTQTLALLNEATVYFTVGDANPPNITLNILDGRVFKQASIVLNFTVNKPASWMGYCLDNGTKTTILGNTTLTVTAGNHTIIVYANDTAGNMGQSETAHFVVLLPAADLKTEDSILLAAVVLVSVAIAATVLVAKRKRKPKTIF
ncbi:MAG TPA: hypothetical protein VLH35_05330, partial [Candidatus Acidoferrales bacterium]|nr:hypothetical protein [Candidatus Acidoferrales bacterium]